MDSLSDILADKDYSLPNEVRAIKAYIEQNYNQEVGVNITTKEIVISSRSAALIGNLRMNGPALKRAAATQKNIRFRIS